PNSPEDAAPDVEQDRDELALAMRAFPGQSRALPASEAREQAALELTLTNANTPRQWRRGAVIV
ncbi:MAG: hypothetical protein AB7S68_42125, partial [Polyangiaceae bacterium]